MSEKHVCEWAHPQILRGVCRWCYRSIEQGVVSGPEVAPSEQAMVTEWNWSVIEQDLQSGNVSLQLNTIECLGDCACELEQALPLVALVLADRDLDVRTMAERTCHQLGRMLTTERITWLESQRDSPQMGRAARTILLGSYFNLKKPASRAARATHIYWMIEHHPDALTAGLPETLLMKSREPAAYEPARQLWLRQCETHRTNATVQGNAARFFLLNDPTLAEKYLLRAQQLEPANPKWHEDLAQLYTLAARHGNQEQSQKQARRSLVELEMAEQLRSGHAPVPTDSKFTAEQRQEMAAMEQVHSLPRRARAALEAGEREFARQFALQALALTSSNQIDEYFRNDGNAIHTCHMVLGHLALGEGRIEQARSHLIESGKTKGAPNLGSFGPNMSLAKELLARGERQVVLEYLELCGQFWELGADRLAQWRDEIERGQMPAFGANLVY